MKHHPLLLDIDERVKDVHVQIQHNERHNCEMIFEPIIIQQKIPWWAVLELLKLKIEADL